MITKVFKNVNANTYMLDLSIKSIYPDGNKDIIFRGYIKTGLTNIDANQAFSLHPDTNRMVITLLPLIDNVEPFEFEYTGNWSNMIHAIKKELLNISRKETSLSLGISFVLEEGKTKYTQIIKSVLSDLEFEQVLTKTDSLYAQAEDLMKKIIDVENENNIASLGEYIYTIMVEE